MAFATGVLALHQFASLPGWDWCCAGALLTAVLAWRRVPRFLTWLSGGFVWAHIYALSTVPAYLPDDTKVMRLVAEGHIISLIEPGTDSARFLFAAERVELGGQWIEGSWRLRLNWYQARDLHPGQRWTLPLRVKSAHGYASPGAWDYEAWLYWQGIRYTGYVDRKLPTRLHGSDACCALTRWRSRLAEAISAQPISTFAAGVIRALVVGDKSRLDRDTKALFQATGTSHLMAISGLHIGLVAGLGLVGISWAWRRVPRLCARVPARLAGGVGALVLATGYALLAGMSLPTQRALIMLTVLVVGLLLRRDTQGVHALAVAAIAVLLWHPPSIMSAGFWLSFGAVAVIMAALNGRSGQSAWVAAIRIQFALSAALWPVLAGFGLPASLAAPFVNLLLVPLFGLLIVPLSLVGGLLSWPFPAEANWLMVPLGWMLDRIGEALALASGSRWGQPLATTSSMPQMLGFGLALVLILAPRGMPMRWAALPLLALPWLPRSAAVAPGDYEVWVLDVGQGLSVVIQTHGHTLLYDTGPEFPSGFSAAQAVVLPFLRQQGIQRIDRLVFSHGDIDHAGGLDAILAGQAVSVIDSGEPARIATTGVRECVAGQSWTWDGVEFEYLHPAAEARLRGNDASCVIRVSNPGGSLLLTGDIGARVEARLASSLEQRLRSDVLLAPHHGSRSSSSAALVKGSAPIHVVYTAGWANRYGFPNAEVDARWAASAAQRWNTGTQGTINIHFSAQGGIAGPFAYREHRRRFWSHDPGYLPSAHAVSSGSGDRR